MKKFLKVFLTLIFIGIVGVTTYVIGYQVGKGKEEKDDAVYMTLQDLKKIVSSAYAMVDESFEALGVSNVNDSAGIDCLKIAGQKDGIIFKAQETDNDVFVKVSGSVVPVSGSVTLDTKTALQGSLKYVQALVSNNVISCADAAATYQIRNAETIPSDFDLKVMVTGYLTSIRINMMLSDTESVFDNLIIVLTFNSANEVYECIYANKDVYAIYNAEANETIYLDFSKDGADQYKNQIKTELDKFEIANSYLDVQTDMSKILLG